MTASVNRIPVYENFPVDVSTFIKEHEGDRKISEILPKSIESGQIVLVAQTQGKISSCLLASVRNHDGANVCVIEEFIPTPNYRPSLVESALIHVLSRESKEYYADHIEAGRNIQDPDFIDLLK